MKIVCMLILSFVAIDFSMARGIINWDNGPNLNSIKDFENTDVSKTSSSSSSSSVEPRKRKPYHDLFLLARKSGFSTVYAKPLHGIAFMGGLQGLVGFVLIKIKIVIVTIAIIGAVALALKVFGVMKYAGYIYKNDYPQIPPSSEYHGYHGPSLHPSISYDNHGNDWSSYDEHYARSSGYNFPARVNMTEIVFSILHVDSDDCRAHLICELDAIMTNSPFFHYFMRHAVAGYQPPSSLNLSQDCAAYHEKCVESSAKNLDRWRKRPKQDDGR